MQIAQLGAADVQLVNKELETAVHKLGFKITGTAGNLLAETIKAPAEDMLDDLIGNASITLTKQDGYNTTTLHQSIPLKDLAEISAFNEGVIYIDREFDGAVLANNTVEMEFTVEIALHSALRMDDQSKLMLTIENKPANTIMTIEALDHADNQPVFIAYENKYVNANVAKDFQIAQHYAMAVPVADIVSIELHYDNGKVVKMNQAEVKKLLRDSQDEVIVYNGIVTYGYHNFAVLSVEHCYLANVTLSNNTNFYLLKEQRA